MTMYRLAGHALMYLGAVLTGSLFGFLYTGSGLGALAGAVLFVCLDAIRRSP